MFTPLDGSATPEPLPTTFDEAVDAAYGLASAFLGIDLQSSLVDLVDGEFLFALWGTGGPASSPSVGFLSETSDPATVIQRLAVFRSSQDSSSERKAKSARTE
ncbi:MAG: hypothetical protein R2845_15440 [Thermomicrobiales bacterium]